MVLGSMPLRRRSRSYSSMAQASANAGGRFLLLRVLPAAGRGWGVGRGRRVNVAVTTVKRAVVQERETGSLERKPIAGCPRRIGPEQEAALRTRLEAAPDATVLEHCAWWAEQYGQQLSEATTWRAIRRLGWTPRKRHWQPASATRRRAPPGVRPLPSSTRSSSSLSTRAAAISP